MQSIISISGLTKTYDSGFQALKNIDLEIDRGEIFALLGPNGAGKSTLINILCSIVNPSGGNIIINGHNLASDPIKARACIGLVPQELATDAFESVWATISFTRGLYGKKKNPAHLEKVLKSLSLWEQKDSPIRFLSGGMKRRLLIAKALSHEPEILFLDEPTAGVDVELRKDMWTVVHQLQESGVTIILTTHYIEEAEQMADRVGIINHGEIILVEEKTTLMQRMGTKRLILDLNKPLKSIPRKLAKFNLELNEDGKQLVYSFDSQGERTGIATLINTLREANIRFRDMETQKSSLEDIFVDLVRKPE